MPRVTQLPSVPEAPQSAVSSSQDQLIKQEPESSEARSEPCQPPSQQRPANWLDSRSRSGSATSTPRSSNIVVKSSWNKMGAVRTRSRSPVRTAVPVARPESPSEPQGPPPVPLPPMPDDDDHEEFTTQELRDMRADMEEGSMDAIMTEQEIAFRESRPVPPQGSSPTASPRWREVTNITSHEQDHGTSAPQGSSVQSKGAYKGESKGKGKSYQNKGKGSWWSSSWWSNYGWNDSSNYSSRNSWR